MLVVAGSSSSLKDNAMTALVTDKPAGPIEVKGLFKKHIVGDEVTLKRFVKRALDDAIPTIKADPYLRASLAEVEGQDDLKRAYDEIDYRVAKAVEFYLRNRSPNERVRARSVSCVSATDLISRRARCIVTVFAWGHMRREIIDLELPQ